MGNETGIEFDQAKANASSVIVATTVEQSIHWLEQVELILTDWLELGADQVLVSGSPEGTTFSIQRGTTELSSHQDRFGQFEDLLKWLHRRQYVPLGDSIWDKAHPVDAEFCAIEFVSSVRLGDQIISFKVKRGSGRNGRNTARLQELTHCSHSSAVEKLGIAGASRETFNEIVEVDSGTVVVAAPDEANLIKSIDSLLVLGNFHYIGALKTGANFEQIYRLSSSRKLLVSVLCADVIDTLLKLRQAQFDLSDSNLHGVVCQGFVKAVCQDCARDTVPDRKFIEQLPAGLYRKEDQPYLVGRGCTSCGLTGYSHSIGVQSMAYVDSELREALRANADQTRLVDLLYPLGTRSLLEDGIDKATKGQITFESLFRLTRTMPDIYLKHAQGQSAAAINSPLVVDGDFFAGEIATIPNRPLSGKLAFKPPIVAADDAPLFAPNQIQKGKSKPVVLVVEDDPDQQSILDMVLKSSDYEVMLANDGLEAMNLIKTRFPDLIMTDLMMPNMDGGQLVKTLKSSPVYKDIPVLVLTVIADADREFKMLDLGADDYCEKTIQRKILLKRIEKLIKRKH